MLENIIPINIYSSNYNTLFDNNDIAKLAINHKKIQDYNSYYLFSQKDSIFIDIIYKIKKSGLYSFIPYIYDILYHKLLTKVINNDDNYIIVFVPSDPKRFVERGFGLNEEILKLASRDGLKTLDCIYKSKHTKNQSLIKIKNKRVINKGIYNLISKASDNLDRVKKIYIFDDFITTGNTILSVAELFSPYNVEIEFISLVGE